MTAFLLMQTTDAVTSVNSRMAFYDFALRYCDGQGTSVRSIPAA